jgi:hypothetical protein
MKPSQPHPIPVCEAFRILGFSGAAVMRSLGLSDNTWEYWRTGGQPRPESRAALVLLARQTMKALQEAATSLPMPQTIMEKAAALIIEQEKTWSLSPLALFRGGNRVSASLK